MTMSDTSTQAVQPTALNTLLMIGAGEGHGIPADWQEYYQQLVLVEPLPEFARSLRLAFGEDPNVEVLETAIVPDVNAGDTVTFYEFNWAQASSRHQPADLLELFPGLKPERMRRVSALSPQQLIQDIGLSPEGEHGLILEAPADEGPILAALIESHAYRCFSRIQLRYPVAGLYDTPEDPESMLQALTDCGFEIESQDRTDPDWPRISLIRSRWKIAFEEMRGTIKALETQLTEQAEALTTAEQLAQDRGAELQKATQERETLEQQLTEQQAKVQALEQCVAETHKRLEQETAAHNALAEARQALEERLNKVQADEGFYTRRHTMLQIDLDNLRERFAESERQRAQQEALLRKLTPRLAQAAQELKKLRIMPAPVPTALGEEAKLPQIQALLETDESGKKKRKRKRKA